MSRSIKHAPITGNAAGNASEKGFKQQWHRAKRRTEHQIDHVLAQQTPITEDLVERRIEPNMVASPYQGPKDGKQYLGAYVQGPLFKVAAKGRKQPAKKIIEKLLKPNTLKK